MKVKMKCLPYQILTLSKYKRVRPVCINLFPSNISAKSTNSHVLFRFGQNNTACWSCPTSQRRVLRTSSHTLFKLMVTLQCCVKELVWWHHSWLHAAEVVVLLVKWQQWIKNKSTPEKLPRCAYSSPTKKKVSFLCEYLWTSFGCFCGNLMWKKTTNLVQMMNTCSSFV